ncbi:MAG: polysaccharide biosynthesis protein [Clostridia bacterium]|nr:polysaccharide biosynthesis protein [Clostridia bacterium]
MKRIIHTGIFRNSFIFLGLTLSFFLSAILSTALTMKTLDFFFDVALIPLFVNIGVIIVFVFLTRLYAISFRYASVTEIIKIFFIAMATFVANIILLFIPYGNEFSLNRDDIEWCVLSFLCMFILSASLICSYRILLYLKYKFISKADSLGHRVLIIGAGSAGTMILRELQITDKINYIPVGFIDDDPNKLGRDILDVRVLGNSESIKEIAEKTKATQIIIAIPSANGSTIKKLTQLCLETKCEVKTLPGIYQLIDGAVSVSKLRKVDVNDLLGREPVNTNLDEVMTYIENNVVLVTGGGGSIGSELCRQIAEHNPKQLIILDIYENNAYAIEQELKRKLPNLNLLTLIASVRDSVKMDDVFKTYRPDIVFHAAAHKHVPLMETSPNEAVKNNILGTYKVVKCADKYGVKRFVQISTDKAVNPTNIMGATKRVCEMIIQAYAKKSSTCFVAVRFGNVLGSNGSVIPLFKEQIAEGGPVTVTHKDIIRYFMTIPEAVSLVLQAGAYAKGGEIFVLDMGEQVKIYDLAVNLIRLSGLEPHKDIEIKITGLRPGEKLYEERLMAEEGLTKTSNNRISIGKPLEMDDELLFKTLDKLYKEAYNESDHMKDLVKELVPTYKIYKD